MNRLSTLICAMLYTGLAAFANPATAQVLTADQKSEVEALREGEMRKLILHSEPETFPQETWFDKDGAEFQIADSNGSIRLVNFWATWCAPCRVEKPALDALQKNMGGPDFEVIAIATGRNDLAAIDRFNEEYGITSLATRLDPKSELARAARVLGLPVTILVNREGQEIGRLTGGADWDSDSAQAIITYLAALPGETG